MPMALATIFRPYVDEQFKKESRRSMVVNNDFDWTGAHTVKIYKVGTAPMNDYGRTGPTGGNFSRYGSIDDLGSSTEEFTLTKDRSFIFNIDKLDQDETENQVQAATALARQNREVTIPEVDTYVYGKMCSGAGTVSTPDVLTSSNIYTKILAANKILDDAEVPEDRRVLIVTPSTYLLMKQCSDIVMNTDVGNDLRLRGVIANLDGLSVQKVPASRLPVAFGFMIAHPSATVAPVKLDESNVHMNTIYGSGAVITGRICYDAFVLDNKSAGIYYQPLAANGLTVTSAAGSTTGKTAITVTPTKGTGNSYKYKTAATVAAPAIGEVCTTGYTTWDGSADITATTGHQILIVEVDSDNKAVKAGSATVTSKA